MERDIPGHIRGAIVVFEICALLGYYEASCDICLPTFRDHGGYVVPKRRQTITTRRRVISQKSADLINIVAEA
jgi:hypothetical protein